MGMHIDATWQIRLNDCATAMSGSATRGGDAACSHVTMGSIVIIIIITIIVPLPSLAMLVG